MSFERANIAAMQGYVSGEQPQDSQTIKLNTNENPYPPTPAIDAVLANLQRDRLRVYPPPTANALRDAIAALHGVTRDQVVVTNGSDEGLRLALTTFVDPKAGFGTLEPSYSLYAVLAAIQDAHHVAIPLAQDWSVPRDAAARLNDAGVRLTCLVNPHAPSGTLLDADTIARIADELEGVLLVDEAYVDFVNPDARYNLCPLLGEYPNLLLLRTFSKGYSLAGIRLGYTMGCEALIRPIVEKTRDSYNVDYICQQLGLAAINDQAYARETWRKVRVERERLGCELQALGFTFPASEANYLLARTPGASAELARNLYTALKSRGVLVRYFDVPRLNDALRITVGTPEQNDRLLENLRQMTGG